MSAAETNGTFSDAAHAIGKRTEPVLFREGWQKIFELADLRGQGCDIIQRESGDPSSVVGRERSSDPGLGAFLLDSLQDGIAKRLACRWIILASPR